MEQEEIIVKEELDLENEESPEAIEVSPMDFVACEITGDQENEVETDLKNNESLEAEAEAPSIALPLPDYLAQSGKKLMI